MGPHFITPDAVDLTIAGFTYSVADVTIYFDFSVIIFGGNAGGVFGGGGGTDDFLFLLDRIAIQDSYFEYLTSSTNDIYTSTTLSLRGVSQPPLVPEPSSLALWQPELLPCSFQPEDAPVANFSRCSVASGVPARLPRRALRAAVVFPFVCAPFSKDKTRFDISPFLDGAFVGSSTPI